MITKMGDGLRKMEFTEVVVGDQVLKPEQTFSLQLPGKTSIGLLRENLWKTICIFHPGIRDIGVPPKFTWYRADGTFISSQTVGEEFDHLGSPRKLSAVFVDYKITNLFKYVWHKNKALKNLNLPGSDMQEQSPKGGGSDDGAIPAIRL